MDTKTEILINDRALAKHITPSPKERNGYKFDFGATKREEQEQERLVKAYLLGLNTL